jgi:hypothetical protein
LLLNLAAVLTPVRVSEELLKEALAARRALAAQKRKILRLGRADCGETRAFGNAERGDKRPLQNPIFPRHAMPKDAQV